MFIWIRSIYEKYPHIENKDIKLVLEIKKPTIYEEPVLINWKFRIAKKYLISDIEKLFWKWN